MIPVTMEPEIVASGVRVRLSGKPVLHGVDLDLRPGVTALVGRNGAGKTTLLRVMAGVLEPSEGTINRAGRSLWTDDESMREHRRGLGWLPPEPGYPPRMTVGGLVEYAAWLKQVSPAHRAGAVAQALEETDLTDRRSMRLGRLSGGQRRRAALAAAVVGRPGLLLLDEPTNGLDPLQRARFLARVTRMASGVSVLLSTHLLEDVVTAADRWCVLDEGRVVASGPVDRSTVAAVATTTAAIQQAIATGGSED